MQRNEVIDLRSYRGAGRDSDTMRDELPAGTRLLRGQYTIVGYLNSGGFAITYRARDSLGRPVVIKECFPEVLSCRMGLNVAPRLQSYGEELKRLIEAFVKEVHALATLSHRNIVHVHQVFEENDTAYMAMDFVDGPDLLDLVERDAGRLTPGEIVRVTRRVLEAVGHVHAEGMLHRDISPDNILIDPSNEPVLIDFGAVRRDIKTSKRAFSRMKFVKDGYSPQEFYIPGAEQGAWSDLYSVAATFYHVISGTAPIDGQRRLAALAQKTEDPYVPLAGRHDGYPDGFLEAIDAALHVLPQHRPQTADDWLGRFATTPESATETDRTRHRPQTPVQRPAQTGSGKPSSSMGKPEPGDTAVQKATQRQRRFGSLLAVAGVAALLASAGTLLLLRAPISQPHPVTGAALPTDISGSIPEHPAEVRNDTSALATQVPTDPAETGQNLPPIEVTEADAPRALPSWAYDEVFGLPETGRASRREGPIATVESGAALVAPVAEPGNLTLMAPSLVVFRSTVTDALPPAPLPSGPPNVDVASSTPSPMRAAESQEAIRGIVNSLWDLDMPFAEAQEQVRSANTVIVTDILQGADLGPSGDWIAPGTIIYAVNDQRLRPGLPLSAQLLEDLRIDPDGYTRATVLYRDPQTGSIGRAILEVPVIRRIVLADGTALEARVIGKTWRVTVTKTPASRRGGLGLGGVLSELATQADTLAREDLAEALDRLALNAVSVAALNAGHEGQPNGGEQ